MQRFSPKPPGTTRVVFVRHGRSTDNDAQRFQGRSNESVLTVRGWDAAYQTGLALRDIKFDAIYTSPLQRALQTSCAVVEKLSSTGSKQPIPSSNPALLEIDLPHWAGRTYASVRKERTADYLCWKTTPEAFSVPSANGNTDHLTFPVLDLYTQLRTFWQKLLEEHRDQTILAIAHGGSIRAAISTAIGLPAKHYHQLQQSNCGISMVDFSADPDHPYVSLRALNLTGHLHETLPKLKAGKQGSRLILLPAESEHLLPSWSNALTLDQCWIDHSIAAKTYSVQMSGPKPSLMMPCATEWGNEARTLAQSASIITVLALVTRPFLRELLRTWLGFSPAVTRKCSILHNTATIIHFPNPTQLPILQALNLTLPDI